MDGKKTKFWREMAFSVNEATTQLIASRQSLLNGGTSPDPRRDLDTECGYPKSIDFHKYKRMFDREGVATRVVTIYPDECWAVDPVVYETERAANTPFEDAWNELNESDEVNPLHYLHRVDIESGVGSYGALLLGLDDGGDLSSPAPGINSRGESIPGRDTKLLFLRAFDESMVRIDQYESDMSNPRFGKPTEYNIVFADMRSQENGVPFLDSGENPQTQASSSLVNHTVHWSRVIHVADNRGSSEVFGRPRMQNVFDKLMDIHKTLGSSAEMFYKGGFPGLSIEIDPRVLEALNIEVDTDAIDEDMYAYMNGLRRYLTLVGMNAKSLAPQVANPEGNVTVELQSIAMSIGAPLRIFMGSEQAKLASGQDVKAWNRRLRRRQHRYLTPMLLRPFINRLIMLGVLPPPERGKFQVFWPDVNMPDEDERSQIADRRAASLMKYVMSGGWQVLQPSDFLRFVWGLDRDEVREIIKNMRKKPEVVFKPLPGQEPPGGPADSGTAGNPPSGSAGLTK